MSVVLVALLTSAPALEPPVLSVQRRRGVPWVEMAWSLTVPIDPPEQSGLTAAAAEVWRGRANRINELTATVDAQPRPGQVVLTAGVAAEQLSTVLPALCKQLFDAEVTDAETEAALALAQARRRAETLDELALARRAIRAELFDGSPLKRPASGSLRGLASITAADLSAYFRGNLVQPRVEIYLAGAVPEDLAWSPPGLPTASAAPRPAPPAPATGRRLIVVDKPGARRAIVAVGRWPVPDPYPGCGRSIRAEYLGFGRALWWLRSRPDEVVADADALAAVARAGPPTDGCAADERAARRARPRLGPRPQPAARPVGARTTTVFVVVTALRAGMAETVSKQLGISSVAVVPYDR